MGAGRQLTRRSADICQTMALNGGRLSSANKASEDYDILVGLARSVYVNSLVDEQNKKGYCNSIERVAKMLDIAETSVRYHVREYAKARIMELSSLM